MSENHNVQSENEYSTCSLNESSTRKRKLSDCMDNVDGYNSESSEDALTIAEFVCKKRKTEMLGIDSVPEELHEIIKFSGIDEILEEKAKKSQLKLTATHVKNIIREVISNPDVSSLLTNLTGTEEKAELSTHYEPKYTRAKTKELLDKHIKESGTDIQTLLPNISNTSYSESYAYKIATEEFPEEDDEDEYDPANDVEAENSEDEIRFSSCNTPVTPAQSIAATTPSTGSISSRKRERSTPSTSHRSISEPMSKIVQRSLDFTKPSDRSQELICSRTRSKYPMLDTPVEYLEMMFKAPDFTSDMYDNTEYDEEYMEFLREYALPSGYVDIVEDDETSDPDFNIMNQINITKEDIKEEIRDDKAVHVSKKEYSEMMTEYLDSMEHDLYDLNDSRSSECAELNSKTVIQTECFNSFNTHYGCETPRCDSVNSIHRSHYKTLTPIRQKEADIDEESSFNFLIENPLCVDGTVQVSSAPIVVNFMIPRFSEYQLKALKIQMMQHIQLLTTFILLCHKCDHWNDMANSARNMFNDICTHANESGNPSNSIFNPWNMRASLDTLAVYDTNQDMDNEYDPKGFSTRRNFTKLLKFVFLNSFAFPFIHLLPKTKYYKPKFTDGSKTHTKHARRFIEPEECYINICMWT